MVKKILVKNAGVIYLAAESHIVFQMPNTLAQSLKNNAFCILKTLLLTLYNINKKIKKKHLL